ncbi:MAG: SigF/SigG family RNA polymerase sporulation sigma factor [Thermovenabulum sp.]|uniref:SigF/SigG family RNA polymerase sporulation sigma factor n=1 Tax=Thermovenabulum sp. TaxID=3100335 RepID=UPI003C7A34D4
MYEENIELLSKAKSGDELAKEKLIQRNLALVYNIAKRFENRGFELEDLIQIGTIGLLKAIDKFDLSYNVKFSTYAVPMIIGEIKRQIRDNNTIKISRKIKEISYKIQKTKEFLEKQLGREPTIREISEELGISIEEINMSLEASKPIISLNEVAYQDDSNPIYVLDKIETNPEDMISILDNISLKEAISKLEGIERKVIFLRYFKDKTQSQIAEILGISQVQVSRLEKRILQKMRNMMF